jgi:rRNA maturation RNase YbeY
MMVFALEAKFKKKEKDLERFLDALIIQTSHSGQTAEVFIVGDKFLAKSGQALLVAYQRAKKQTKLPKSFNVLAFPAPANFPIGEDKKENLGEIYLNLDQIRKNNENLYQMLIHGFLHLIGYDHISKNDRMRMEKEERRLYAFFKKENNTIEASY